MDNFPVTNTPPNTPMSDSGPTLFECVVCTDECQWPPTLQIFGHCICKECFDRGMKPQFENHLKNEFAAPKWEGDVIDFNSVQANFTADFVWEYKMKMEEYAIFPNRRIYCAGRDGEPCGSFVGSKEDTPAAVVCSKCDTVTCAVCTSRVDPRAYYEHDCQEQKKEDTSGMDGLQRGKDFQTCPKCATPCQLMDGCNHITCELTACGCEFCFICGEQAMEGQGHWDVGKPCPKYNHPDDGNAMFEPPGLAAGLPLGGDPNEWPIRFNDGNAMRMPPVIQWDAPLPVWPNHPDGLPADQLLDWADTQPDLQQADADMDILFTEVDHDLTSPRALNDPGQPEAILRRVDRQRLEEIHLEVLGILQTAGNQGQVQPWMGLLADFTTFLSPLLQIYTLQSSPEEVRQAWTRHRWATTDDLDRIVTIRNFLEVRHRFPDLLPIIDRWQLADAGVDGWQEQFRLQLEGMRAERQRVQAIQQEANRILLGMQHR
ncbi:hypothetical protein CBER1_05521 [Cercospora berteroae]|uniref:RING-type domain-containing protein n=1 Tax=Cercospora berteroae TaxID=357750 RepID=A0A2S6BSU0_9PEZI|nr:hypothetical protein CBER1_05521 [Cercospora berteroae]